MNPPADCTKAEASRYQSVKKRIKRTHTVTVGSNGAAPREFVVYSPGTLCRERPAGTPLKAIARLTATLSKAPR